MLDVKSDFSPFWDERMLSIPCQEGTEVRELIQLGFFPSIFPKHLF